MSKLARFSAIAALIAGVLAMTPGPAAAQHHHGGSWHGGGGWHGGGWRGGGWGPGFALGLGFGPAWGWGPYAYYPEPYVEGPDCGWARVRVLRHGHWVPRRVWRCW